LIHLETKQIAESIQRVKAVGPLANTKNQEAKLFERRSYKEIKIPSHIKGRAYLLEFDPSLKMSDHWVSDWELTILNSLRDEVAL
jgi:hypothetical protein